MTIQIYIAICFLLWLTGLIIIGYSDVSDKELSVVILSFCSIFWPLALIGIPFVGFALLFIQIGKSIKKYSNK